MDETVKVQPEKIILGTMRLHERDRSTKKWAEFFQGVYERGIRILHSSSEYESYPLLVEILALLRRDSPTVLFDHIVKLANPSFHDSDFHSLQMSKDIDLYKHSLNADHIADVQWMWRRDLNDDAKRQSMFCHASARIADATAELKASGAVGRLLCFPYSTGFAATALKCEFIDGLVVYRNAQETDYDAVLDITAECNKTAIIIRPFNAGKLIDNTQQCALKSLAMALSKPAIESAIISSGSLEHIDQLIDC